MFAKLRFNSIPSYTGLHDALCALFETKATTVSQLYAGLNSTVQPYFDEANSFITAAKSPYGWDVDYVSGSTTSRNMILKSACKNSAKSKYAYLGTTANTCTITTGQARNGNTLNDLLAVATWYTTSILPIAQILELYVSSSSRHLLVCAMRIDTQSSMSSGVFEFVTNDGYYTETSPYIPVALAAGLEISTNYSASTRALRVPRYKNMRANGYPDVTAQSCYWETPYSEDDFDPADNNGYDYIGNSSDRTPLLIPFGVCNKKTHAFAGGAISDLCDIYLGPPNVGGNFEETLIGTDSYISIPIRANTKRLFVPKG